MFKNFVFISVSFLLLGCAGAHTSQTQNYLETAAKRELSAWAEVQKLYVEKCPVSTPATPLPRERALESNECYESLAREIVIPVAIDVTEANKFLLVNKKISLEYKQGKIDRDESRIKVQENWLDYVERIDAKGNAALNAAVEKDSQLAEQRQRYLQNVSRQFNAHEAQNTSTKPKNTNCHIFADQMQCTTW